MNPFLTRFSIYSPFSCSNPSSFFFSDVKQSVVLSGGELNHYYRLASMDDTYVNELQAHRAEMRQRSKARYSKWSNTLEAQRLKKKSDRLKKLEQLELEQQVIDEEEAKYQEAQRRVVLDRANRLLWQDTDKVKNFHGGLLLASVLKEREAQLELAVAKKSQRKKIDQTYHDIAEEDRLKALEMERLEQEKRHEASRQAASQQLEQLRQVRMRQAVERLEEVEEGERIKRVALEAVKEAEEEEKRRQEKMWSYNQEYLRANDEQLAMKQARLAVEKLEDDKIAAFAAEKDRLTNLRKDHERAKFLSKQARFEKMLKRQYDHLSNIREQEAARTEKHVKEIEKREDDRIAADQRKREELKETIRISRQAQLDRKAAEQERQRQHEEMMTKEWKKRNLEREEAEWNEDRKIYEEALRLQQTLRQQMIAKEEKVRSEVEKEYEEARMMKEACDREDAVFSDYCKTQLGELQLKGKSTLPLELILHKERIKSQRLGNHAIINFR